MRAASRRQRGVSLVEALVAMTVLSIGTLGVLGVQATLRSNSDVSKQRSEAVRIAQELIEDRRGFADRAGYDGIGAGTDTVNGLNATFTVTREVVDPAAISIHAPRLKSLRVTVSWPDRGGQTQQVRMTTVIHGIPPALAGSMALPADLAPVITPGGRHAAIPRDAEVITSGTLAGTSRFTPQPGSDLRWYFNNVSGAITTICTSIDTSCTAVNARLLSGYIRYATLTVPGVDPGESPTGYDPATETFLGGLGVTVNLTVPASPASVICSTRTLDASARTYFCAVPVEAGTGIWSGRANVSGLGEAQLASSAVSSEAGRYRVCRYTPFRDGHPVAPTGMRNDQHPLNYVGVRGALLNQNFLVRRAADGCPADGPSPLFNSNTWHHQPAM